MPQFDETELTAAVIRSFDDTPDPRAKFLLQELVKSLHEYVRRTDLTFEDFEGARATCPASRAATPSHPLVLP